MATQGQSKNWRRDFDGQLGRLRHWMAVEERDRKRAIKTTAEVALRFSRINSLLSRLEWRRSELEQLEIRISYLSLPWWRRLFTRRPF